jgi:hypothetical protein
MKRLIARKTYQRHPKPTRPMRLRVEQLERRDLMTATPFDTTFALANGGCNCPICTGRGLPQQVENSTVSHATTATTTTTTSTTTKYALNSLPNLSSAPGAKAKLVLDFNGNTLTSWGGKTNVVSKVYDIDGDATTFSDKELANIKEIWARVAEDYAPFNIDVTTVDPGVLTDKVVAKIVIGGSYTDWYGSSAGGVAYVGGFYNGASNVGFAFSTNLGSGNPKYVADAASHEAGHLFGLQHQAKWNGTTLVASYNQGNSSWAPIMGVGYYASVSVWSNGATSVSSTSFQDDMSILAGANNGFGYRVNAQGSSAAAGTLGTSGTFNVSGRIAQNSDQQWWKFSTSGGNATFNVNTIAAGANLDSVLEIRNESGTVLYTANSATSLNSTLSVSLASGTYYAVVRSTGVYGYVGQYALTGTFVSGSPAAPPPPTTTTTDVSATAKPEITILAGTSNITNWGTVWFGSVSLGNFVDKTFTIRNDGTGPLSLQAIDAALLPAGISIVSNIGQTSLQAGQTTTFTIRMAATTVGSVLQTFRISNNDADEGTYYIRVSGTVTAPTTTTTAASIALIDLALTNWTKRR